MTNEEMAVILDERAKNARAAASYYPDGSPLFDEWIRQAEASEAGAAALRALEEIANLNRYEGVPDIECEFCFEEGGEHSADCPVGIALAVSFPPPPKEGA